VSKLASLAKRISPPGTSDCSGSHCFTVPLIVTVLTLAHVSPPNPSAARLTRSCSRDGPLAQDTKPRIEKRTTNARFMIPPPGEWTSLGEQRQSATIPAREGSSAPGNLSRRGWPGCGAWLAGDPPTCRRCPCGRRLRRRRRAPTTSRDRSRFSARPGASRRSPRSSAPRWGGLDDVIDGVGAEREVHVLHQQHGACA